MKNDYIKIGIGIVLSIFLIFAIVQIVEFSFRRSDARSNYEAAKRDFDRAAADRAALQEDFDYFSNPVNIEKEMRARFNYALPGEKSLILVPVSSST